MSSRWQRRSLGTGYAKLRQRDCLSGNHSSHLEAQDCASPQSCIWPSPNHQSATERRFQPLYRTTNALLGFRAVVVMSLSILVSSNRSFLGFSP